MSDARDMGMLRNHSYQQKTQVNLSEQESATSVLGVVVQFHFVDANAQPGRVVTELGAVEAV